MKSQAFLELVGEMLKTQQDYFEAKRKGDANRTAILIKSKGLERQVAAVVKGGRLEADEPTASTTHTSDDAPIYVLDLSGDERPTDGQGEQP